MRPEYDHEKEHEVIGMYPPIKGMQLGGTGTAVNTVPESPQLWRPVTPKENYKMLFKGETPYWIPVCGWFNCDVNEFRPRQHPDNMANHQCLDGGDEPGYETMPLVLKGWFGIPYEWETNVMGATVRPGNPTIEDINGWREKLTLPDLNAMDWDEMRALNTEYLGTDKANQLGIQFGLWERLMCLMDVDNAAVALVDEDQEEELHAFLDWLADLYIDYIDRVCEIGPIDTIMMHDDWGTNTSTFFSLDTCMEFIVPALKKVVDHAHSKGIIFELHSCGKGAPLVPAMIAAGVDYWMPQQPLNDIDEIIERHIDDPITFAVANPVIPKGSSKEDVRKQAAEWVEKYKDKGILLVHNGAIVADPNHDDSLYPAFVDAVYEFSRKAFQDAE